MLVGGTSAAAADDIRNRQWDLKQAKAEEVWKHSTGQGVTVGVVDTGVDDKHEDLRGQVIAGKDFSDTDSSTIDLDGHGTQVAGVIAAHGHGPGGNSGMKGLAPDAKILSVKKEEYGSAEQAIRYAVDHDVSVLNLSYSTTLGYGERDAVNYAISKDVVVVAEAGNVSRKKKNYPASLPGVVSVGAVDQDGVLTMDSSWGDTTLVAPAEDLVSPDRSAESGYSFFSGTSAATAQVSASAALIRAEHPDLTAGQVINRLVKSAGPPRDESGKKLKLPDDKYGYGVIRPLQAITSDISAGPEEGPLEQPKPEPSEPAASGTGGSSDDDGMQWMYWFGPPLVTFGVFFVLLILVVVLVIALVRSARRSKGTSTAAGPDGWPPQPVGGQWPAAQGPPQPGQYGPYAPGPPVQGQPVQGQGPGHLQDQSPGQAWPPPGQFGAPQAPPQVPPSPAGPNGPQPGT